jgi:acyl carrier protein
MNTLKAIANIVGEDIDADDNIRHDSLDRLQLILDCEAYFDINLEDNRLMKCRTYSELARLIEEVLSNE